LHIVLLSAALVLIPKGLLNNVQEKQSPLGRIQLYAGCLHIVNIMFAVMLGLPTVKVYQEKQKPKFRLRMVLDIYL
jgi:hypothetical protein